VVSGVIDTADHQKSRFHNRISLQIRSHMQKTFSLWVRGPDEVVCWKKPEGRNSRDRVPLRFNPLFFSLKINQPSLHAWHNKVE
jgi:hypothetical protein